MIVRFDLECSRKTASDVDHAGVLTRPLQHAVAACRKLAQVDPRRLVRAVLGPHHREDSQLGEGRFASEQFDYVLVFLFGESVASNHLGSNYRFIHFGALFADLTEKLTGMLTVESKLIKRRGSKLEVD